MAGWLSDGDWATRDDCNWLGLIEVASGRATARPPLPAEQRRAWAEVAMAALARADFLGALPHHEIALRRLLLLASLAGDALGSETPDQVARLLLHELALSPDEVRAVPREPGRPELLLGLRRLKNLLQVADLLLAKVGDPEPRATLGAWLEVRPTLP